jgi:glycosyltransferase involved in cell wall biosynthesis
MDPVVVIPAFQPSHSLVRIVQALRARSAAPIVVVNDGSEERYAPLFGAVAAVPGAITLAHGANLGKGRALRTAMEHVLRAHAGAPGIVTADADGQHDVDDILRVADVLRACPSALVLGARQFGPAVPRLNRSGNILIRWILERLAGIRLSDTQTGLRGIPAARLPELTRLRSTRFDFETEMLLWVWARGVEIREVPIRTIYVTPGRVSHYRPLTDSIRIGVVIARSAGVGSES